MTRIVTALVLATGLWLLLRVAPHPLFSVVTLAVIGMASAECYGMLAATGTRAFRAVGIPAAVAVAGSFGGAYEAHVPLVAGGALTLALAMARRPTPREMLDSALHTVFPVLFIGLSLGFLIGLRSMPGDDGGDLLMLLFVCVISADTFAYYVGRAFGRRPMAQVLSPRKTWAGAAGGVAASVLAGALAHVWFYRRLPWSHSLVLGAILGLAAIAGDLAESMVKRATGVKDSSRLLPGHGGVLDRTDSLIFSAPILYYYYGIVLRGVS